MDDIPGRFWIATDPLISLAFDPSTASGIPLETVGDRLMRKVREVATPKKSFFQSVFVDAELLPPRSRALPPMTAREAAVVERAMMLNRVAAEHGGDVMEVAEDLRALFRACDELDQEWKR